MVKSKKLIVPRYLNTIILIKKGVSYDFFTENELETLLETPLTLNHTIDRKIKQDHIEYYWSYSVPDNSSFLLKLKSYSNIVFINSSNMHKYNVSLKVKNILKLIHI